MGVRHYDIRSAYGWAMAQLPDMLGTWSQSETCTGWGLCKVQWDLDESKHPVMPFPVRDKSGYIHYPPRGTGWYWYPLFRAACEHYGIQDIKLLDLWTYTPASTVKPFWYMEELYAARMALAAANDPAAAFIKLLMVSTWGRMCSMGDAKRGWTTRDSPTRGLLDWAGMTTALIQERMLNAIHTTGPENFIACCVDGFWTTDLFDCGPNHNNLGDWASEKVDELFLLRPACYWARRGEEWEAKTSGLPDSDDLLEAVFEQWGCKRHRGAIQTTQRLCRGLLQCYRNGEDYSRLGEFDTVPQVLHLNPGFGRYGHTCPTQSSGEMDWERWLPYWPPVSSVETESVEFTSRTGRTIPEEVAGRAISEVEE